MSNFISRVSRTLVGSLFVYGGQNAIRNSAHLEPMVEAKRAQLGLNKLPASTSQLIQANGAGMVALGSTLALGVFPRLSALGLVGLLTPTTLAAHSFWEIEDPQRRNQEMTKFFSNLAAAGGLIGVLAHKK